ncbi:SH3 domain-containing protein [Neogemmobacter tilapiae]|uniref:SH3 domain-containing protein n=1 Tax=Neogemmobacter tilapiae TaxID=875041 RepID=A0A918TMA1_9RHOB|nr:SH3 domain-containing protein [Gemmobacter tilapiae]GHC54096.1 hypothetical protein GCM10007315_16130 [Gemmobacter tilapiae]
MTNFIPKTHAMPRAPFGGRKGINLTRALLGLLVITATLPGTTAPLWAQNDMRLEQVHFPPGATGATINGRITGNEFVVYKIGAEAGQQIAIDLRADNTATYFNLYAPGNGPGDEALVIGEQLATANSYAGLLPTSGEYGLSVFLYRSAARRGETSTYRIKLSVSGDTGEVAEGDFADGLQGGPDFWAVQTSGGPLTLRAEASTGAGVVARLATGTPLRNLGCRMAEGRRWCNVATLSDPGLEGWAAGEFLVEGSGDGVATQLPDMLPVPADGEDALVPGTDFNATGTVDCARTAGALTESCAFGVTRQGNGNGVVTIEWPDGRSRVIVFASGEAVAYDQSEAEKDTAMSAVRDGSDSIVTIGQERFVIPDAVIWGG